MYVAKHNPAVSKELYSVHLHVNLIIDQLIQFNSQNSCAVLQTWNGVSRMRSKF